MKCIKCNTDLEHDDNFCYKCGYFSAHGYFNIKDNNDNNNNNAIRQSNNVANLFITLFVFIIIFSFIIFIRGIDILKPFVYIKRQAYNYKLKYNATLIVNDRQYNGVIVNNKDEGLDYIIRDINSQKWQCRNDYDVVKSEYNLVNKYGISAVSFCDIDKDNVKKIENVIDNFYVLFPYTDGKLTNISVTNAVNKDDYVAYFQPVYVFVNSDKDINKYNRVSKTQILLNSYYFLNNNVNISNDLYVKDSDKTSLIAHELGHYLLFLMVLKDSNVSDVTFITRDNVDKVNSVISISNNSSYSKKIIDDVSSKYNITVDNLAKSISNYAYNKVVEGIYDEVIAEAVHDYYLHGDNTGKYSLEIVNIIKNKLR